ncbi:TPA: DUF4102 domain-containing protein [Vibrio parahaemolyticus]|nr:DUF4102 domain-containing protein [Vibrio parahaemolyticus]
MCFSFIGFLIASKIYIVYHVKPINTGLARFYKSGKISFCYRFRWQGKQAILTIGTYPQVSLKEARDIHREAQRY